MIRRRKRKTWRLYSQRRRDGSYEIHPSASMPTAKLPKKAILSADGNWAELHDKHGLARVLVASQVPSEQGKTGQSV